MRLWSHSPVIQESSSILYTHRHPTTLLDRFVYSCHLPDLVVYCVCPLGIFDIFPSTSTEYYCLYLCLSLCFLLSLCFSLSFRGSTRASANPGRLTSRPRREPQCAVLGASCFCLPLSVTIHLNKDSFPCLVSGSLFGCFFTISAILQIALDWTTTPQSRTVFPVAFLSLAHARVRNTTTRLLCRRCMRSTRFAQVFPTRILTSVACELYPRLGTENQGIFIYPSSSPSSHSA